MAARIGAALSLFGVISQLCLISSIVAAVGFAGLLVVVLRSGEVRSMLTDIIRSALSIPS